MKKIQIIGLVLLIALSLCACGGSKGADTEMVKEFLGALYGGDYTAASAYICDEVADSLDTEEMAVIVDTTIADYGAFSAINDVVESNIGYYFDMMGIDPDSAAANLDDYDVYYASLSFEKDEIGIFFLVDSKEHLIYGITVVGSESDDGYHSHGGQIHKHSAS
ncbi:MAG: hypothetical protein IIY02_03695 [Firmicutes bacterium]|nr:hypothetical protein [Bacillota bacterium]